MARTKVFISYSHQDEAWKDLVTTHLGILEAEGLLHVWTDRRIQIGEDWQVKIDRAMTDTRVAILLVTASFLTSPFILNTEIPRLLKLHAQDGMLILPVVVRPCAWKLVAWLAPRQVRPQDGRPLAAGSDVEVDADLTALAYEVAALIGRVGEEAAVEGLAITDRLSARRERTSVKSAPDVPSNSPVPRLAVASVDAAYQALEQNLAVLSDRGPITPQAVVRLINEAISRGVPIYNSGAPLACALIYLYATQLILGCLAGANAALEHGRAAERARQLLPAVAVSMDTLTHRNAADVAWKVRLAFDEIVQTAAEDSSKGRP